LSAGHLFYLFTKGVKIKQSMAIRSAQYTCSNIYICKVKNNGGQYSRKQLTRETLICL